MKLFLRNAGEWAEQVMKTDYPIEVGSKADLTSKMEIGNEVFLPFFWQG